MTTQSASILYYPSIEFADDSWVKSAAIVWDHVYRIVPSGYRPKDSDEIKQAIDCGFVRDVTIDDADREKTSHLYDEFIEQQPFLPHGLTSDDRFSFLHQEKIDGRLYKKMQERARHVFADGRLQLPAGLARGYMFFFAKTIAERRGMTLGTDDADAWTIFSYFSQDGNFDDLTYNPSAPMHYGFIALEKLIPSDFTSISMRDLMVFVEKRQAEKEQFRTSLNALTDRLQSIANLNQRDIEIRDYCNALERSTENLKRSTSGFLPSGMTTTMFVKGLPMTLSVYNALKVFDPYSWTPISTGLLAGAVAAMLQKDQPKPSPESYLIQIRKEAATLTRRPNFHLAFEEFMND